MSCQPGVLSPAIWKTFRGTLRRMRTTGGLGKPMAGRWGENIRKPHRIELLQFIAISFPNKQLNTFKLDQNEEKQIFVLIFGWIPRKVQIYDRVFVVSDGNKVPDASTTIWNSPGSGVQQRLFGWHKIWLVATQIVFIFTRKIGEDEPILTITFFKWVGSTTN